MDYREEYKHWLIKADSDTVSELKKLSESEIKERFYKTLNFGTSGLRGLMGAGTNRMNIYTVGRVTKGLSQYIINQGQYACRRGVVIAYDSRINSHEFAVHTANVLLANNIKVYLFEDLRPTPMLSFAVRHLKAFAGIVITASHNPREYNGYKVYFEDGAQLSSKVSDKVLSYINDVDVFDVSSESNNTPIIIGHQIDEAYYNCVLEQAINKGIDKSKFRMVYTPLNGSGNLHVREILRRQGYEKVYLVEEQLEPDGNFPTVKCPNPENKECFNLAINLARKNNCSLVIATDPDSDRVGAFVKNAFNEYSQLTGNQTGVLLCDYILSQKVLPDKPAVVSTIVSSKLIEKICYKYGVKYFEVLTGFKYIGEKIHEFEIENNYNFVLGIEESFGYLFGTYARDKDAVAATMIISEMAVYYYKQGLSLFDKLRQIYEEHGYYIDEVVSVHFKGIDEINKMKTIMDMVREKNIVGKFNIIKSIDYLNDETGLPKSNAVMFKLAGGDSIVIRPSETESKLKFYFSTNAQTSVDARKKIDDLKIIAENLTTLKIHRNN